MLNVTYWYAQCPAQGSAVIDGLRCSDGGVYVFARQGLRGILKGGAVLTLRRSRRPDNNFNKITVTASYIGFKKSTCQSLGFICTLALSREWGRFDRTSNNTTTGYFIKIKWVSCLNYLPGQSLSSEQCHRLVLQCYELPQDFFDMYLVCRNEKAVVNRLQRLWKKNSGITLWA